MKLEDLQELLSLKKEIAELESAKRKIESQTVEGEPGGVRLSGKRTPYVTKLRKSDGFHETAENRRKETIKGIRRDIDAKAAKLERLEKETLDYIETLGDERIKLIMRLRYIDGYKWAKVGELIGYDRTHALKLLRAFMRKAGGGG